MGHILHGKFLLKRLIEGKIEGGIEVTERRRGKRKQLFNDPKEKTGFCKLQAEALDRAVWRTGYGAGYGNVVIQSRE
jgi:hypothetical protein